MKIYLKTCLLRHGFKAMDDVPVYTDNVLAKVIAKERFLKGIKLHGSKLHNNFISDDCKVQWGCKMPSFPAVYTGLAINKGFGEHIFKVIIYKSSTSSTKEKLQFFIIHRN